MSAPTRRYEVLHVLGKGGFGTVYRARMVAGSGFTKEVALKIARTDATPEKIERLREEARILGRVRHRAIVAVDGLVRLAGRWALSMEYVDGVDLLRIRRHQQTLPPGVVIEVIREVADALHIAFRTIGPDGRPLRLAHRDVKPANILLTGVGEVKVLDFGIATGLSDEPAPPELDFGSPRYMAPERHAGEDHERSDVYSLGVLAVELVTGQPPNRTWPDAERAEQVRTETLTRLRGLDPALLALVDRMLSYAAESRPSAREVEQQLAALQPALGGPRLRDWAEEQVAPMAVALRSWQLLQPDDLVGKQLVEQADDAATVPPPEPRETSPDAVTTIFGKGDARAMTLDDDDDDDPPPPGEARPTATDEPSPDAGAAPVGTESATTTPAVAAAPNPTPDVDDVATVTSGPPPISVADVETAGKDVVPVSRAWSPALVAIALVVLLVVLGGGFLSLAGVVGVGGAVALAPDAPEPKVAPSPVTPRRPDPAPAPRPPPPEPVPTLSPEPVPTPPTPTPTPTPTPSPTPTRATVEVTGDATNVTLVAGKKSYQVPGRVPPGEYDVQASFGGAPRQAGKVTIAAGAKHRIRCNGAFEVCKVD